METNTENDGQEEVINQDQSDLTDQDYENEDIKKNHDVAAFAWILVFAPVLLVLRRDSEFIKFHAKQAIILFIFAVLIFSLPKPFSNLNILLLAVAVAGFINANMGRWWKVPFLYELVEKGFTPSSIAGWLVDVLFGFFDTIRRIFTAGPGFAIKGTMLAFGRVRGVDALTVNSRVTDMEKKLQEENLQLSKRADFLEKEILIGKYLRGERAVNLSDKFRTSLETIKQVFSKRSSDIVVVDMKEYVEFHLGDKCVVIGNYDENGLIVFYNFPDPTDRHEITFSKWAGIGVLFLRQEVALPRLEKVALRFVYKEKKEADELQK